MDLTLQQIILYGAFAFIINCIVIYQIISSATKSKEQVEKLQKIIDLLTPKEGENTESEK